MSAARLIKCLREGLPTDMNVYDAVALSAVVHLSAQSVAKKSAAVDFPDSHGDGGGRPSRWEYAAAESSSMCDR